MNKHIEEAVNNDPANLYGAQIYGIHPWQDYLFNVEEGCLQIIYIPEKKYSPVILAFAENNRGNTYTIKVKEAVKSGEFMDRLSSKDRKVLIKLASLNPPKHKY